jgi:glutamyl-tRNA synthetase
MRSDGSPTYHLAVVTDDIDMEITHVIRGDDHVSNTPRQIHIYNALNAPLPYFAHVPMILGPDKTKLSKRHGAEAVMEYQQQGFLPEAMINMLARLGWSHGDQEIFALQELIDLFDLKAVGKSPSVFDRDKLVSLNHHYIQRCAPPRLESMLAPFLAELGISAPHQPTLRACLPHIIPRGRTLAELAYWAQPYLLELPLLESAVRAKFLTPANKPILRRLLYLLETCAPGDDLEAAVTALSRELDMKLGALLPLLRAALTGRAVSPGIFEVIAVLGRQRSIARLKAALAEIN